MESAEAASLVRAWLESEGLELKVKGDEKAEFHYLVRYPPTRHGHIFSVACPGGRDLVVVSSITQVDAGQQDEMSHHAKEEADVWEEWLHDTRMHLTRAMVDWVLHVGKGEEDSSGPLQAFNVSEPTWLDGLTKHTLMQSLRRLWLAKLALIHEIKFSYGPGIGKPGPVDDWGRGGTPSGSRPAGRRKEDTVVETDESGGFGDDFDPSDWA